MIISLMITYVAECRRCRMQAHLINELNVVEKLFVETAFLTTEKASIAPVMSSEISFSFAEGHRQKTRKSGMENTVLH